jgi:hypothetical protein
MKSLPEFVPPLPMPVQRTLKSLQNVQLLAFNHQQDTLRVAHYILLGVINKNGKANNHPCN